MAAASAAQSISISVSDRKFVFTTSGQFPQEIFPRFCNHLYNIGRTLSVLATDSLTFQAEPCQFSSENVDSLCAALKKYESAVSMEDATKKILDRAPDDLFRSKLEERFNEARTAREAAKVALNAVQSNTHIAVFWETRIVTAENKTLS